MNFVNERTRGKLPLSIGTSLGFESLLNIHDDIKHKDFPYKKIDALWINIRTLYRNIYNSIDKDYIDLTTDNDMKNALISEIDTIKDICSSEADGIDVVFYCPSYVGLDNINKEVLLRLDNTSLQKKFTKRLQKTIKLMSYMFNKDKKNIDPDKIKIYDNLITDKEDRKTIMISNFAYDLISYNMFKELSLLETHTGSIKGRSQWYTKYYNGNKLPEIPFRLDLLTVLGDNTLFRCKVPQFKKEIIRLAEEHEWTSITSTDKIRNSISTIKNHSIRLRLLDVIE